MEMHSDILNITCAICTDTFRSSDIVFATQCGHIFHVNCIRTWLNRSQTCPQCRKHCNDEAIHRVYLPAGTEIQLIQKKLEDSTLELNQCRYQLKRKIDKVEDLTYKQRKKDSLLRTYKERNKDDEKTITNLRSELYRYKRIITEASRISKFFSDEGKKLDDILNREKNIAKVSVRAHRHKGGVYNDIIPSSRGERCCKNYCYIEEENRRLQENQYFCAPFAHIAGPPPLETTNLGPTEDQLVFPDSTILCGAHAHI